MNESSDNKTLSCVHFGSWCLVVGSFFSSEIETRNYRRMRDDERTKKKQDKEEEVEKKTIENDTITA